MYLIQNIPSNPLQKQNIVLADGSTVSLTLYFRPLQYGWFINELIYGTFVLNGLRITNSPNMLYQFQNQLPFGLACFSVADREPSQQQDFSSGNSKLYILSEAEVAEFSAYIKNG